MRSPLLALFVRSVRQDVRDTVTYWVRAGLGVCCLLVLLGIDAGSSWVGAPGRSLFVSIVTLQMLAITFVGLNYFASAIAEEKEEQTLGLLRMTGLDSLSILLGKSTSRLCGVLLFVTAQLPFTVFAVTLGGISLRQITAAYCTVLAYTFLLCNVALLGSVLARRTTGAVLFCLVTPILLGLGWIVLEGLHHLFRNLYGWHSPLDWLASLIPAVSPLGRLQEILEIGFNGLPIGRQVIVDFCFGAGCFLLAWALFERLCDRASEKAFSISRPPLVGLAVRFRFGLRWLQPSRVWKAALVWKDFYFLHGGRTAFVLRTVVYGSVMASSAWGFMRGAPPSSQMGFNLSIGSILPWIFSIDLAVMAARIIRAELNEQTFAALTILPGTLRELVNRKVLACLLAAAPGALCCLVDEILFFAFSGSFAGRSSVETRWMNLLQIPCHVAIAALLLWLVIRLSLSMKRGAGPLGWILTMMIVAGLMVMCGIIAAGAVALTTSRTPWIGTMGDTDFVAPILFVLQGLGVAGLFRLFGLARLEQLVREN